MPELVWNGKETAVKAAGAVPYRLLVEDRELSFGADAENMLIQGDNLAALKALLHYYKGQVRCVYAVPHLKWGVLGGITMKMSKNDKYEENDIGDGIVSHIFSVFRPKSEYDINFWKYYINNERVMRPLLMRSTKSSTMMHDLVVNDILKEEILVPTLPEQHRIGAFFQNLESLIAVRQKKLAKLQNLKKALLQKMFV